MKIPDQDDFKWRPIYKMKSKDKNSLENERARSLAKTDRISKETTPTPESSRAINGDGSSPDTFAHEKERLEKSIDEISYAKKQLGNRRELQRILSIRKAELKGLLKGRSLTIQEIKNSLKDMIGVNYNTIFYTDISKKLEEMLKEVSHE